MAKDYYIFNAGRIKRHENTIQFIPADSTIDKRNLPIEDTQRLHCFGEIDVNSKALNYLATHGVVVSFYNYYGFYTGSFYPREKHLSGLVHVYQAEKYLELEQRLKIAKQFIESGVHHILRLIRRHAKMSEEVNIVYEAIIEHRKLIAPATSIEELMGIEGVIRKAYYSTYKFILGEEFSLEKREKRPPKSPMNALMSFGNSMIYSNLLSTIYQTQLDPTISYLHEPSTRRFSLSLDMSEIFKPLIVDSLIFSLVNNKQIKIEHFECIDDEIYLLNDMGRKIFIKAFEEKLKTTIKHRVLKRQVSYRTLMKLECYKLIKHVIDDQEYVAFKAWW